MSRNLRKALTAALVEEPTDSPSSMIKKDCRSPLAVARDKYFGSRGGGYGADNIQSLGNENPSYYLRNRLDAAFLAGARAQEVISDEDHDWIIQVSKRTLTKK